MLLEYGDAGPGPLVVLLHGFPLDRTMWEFQIGSIGSTYRVLTPDLRGHGRSVAPAGTYTIDAMADDVIETLDSLELTAPLVLGGLSMGGYVALSIAARYPERLRALMLMDTKATADTPDAARVREDLAREVERGNSVQPVVQAMLPRLFAPGNRTRRADRLTRLGEQMMRTPALGVIGALRGLALRPDRTADLARITCPTLALVGAEDAITPPADMKAIASKVPNARYVEVPEAGHLAPLENPTAVDAAILDFLKSLPA